MPTIYKVVRVVDSLLRSAKVPVGDPYCFCYQPLAPLPAPTGQPIFGFESIAVARRWMERDRDQAAWNSFQLWDAQVPEILPTRNFVSGYAYSPFIERYWKWDCPQRLSVPTGSVLCEVVTLLHNLTPFCWTKGYPHLKASRITELRAMSDRDVPQFDYGSRLLSINDLIDEIGGDSAIGMHDVKLNSKAKL